MLYAIYAVDKVCGSKSDGWHIDSQLRSIGVIEVSLPVIDGDKQTLASMQQAGFLKRVFGKYLNVQTDLSWEYPRIEIGSSITHKPQFVLEVMED